MIIINDKKLRSGCCTFFWNMLHFWFGINKLNYCVGIARNPRLSDHISRAEKPAKIVRDLWKHKNIDKKTTKVSVQVKPHEVVLVRINKGA